tara:strand:+ start:10909 stop:11742 length:834 start_codon:yes stop_codon:yes gene_type:complete
MAKTEPSMIKKLDPPGTGNDPMGLMDLPSGSYTTEQLAEIIESKGFVVEDDGGWTYLFKPDDSVTILQAGSGGTQDAVGLVLTKGKAYDDIKEKFGGIKGARSEAPPKASSPSEGSAELAGMNLTEAELSPAPKSAEMSGMDLTEEEMYVPPKFGSELDPEKMAKSEEDLVPHKGRWKQFASDIMAEGKEVVGSAFSMASEAYEGFKTGQEDDYLDLIDKHSRASEVAQKEKFQGMKDDKARRTEMWKSIDEAKEKALSQGEAAAADLMEKAKSLLS